MKESFFDPLKTLKPQLQAALVFVVSFLLICLRLGTLAVPPILTCDEASIGLNAQGILTTGADEWGQRLPLFFKAFGEYKSPVFIYSSLPLIKLLGLNLYAIRLTAAIWGLLTIIFTSLFVWELTKNKTVAFISLIVASTLPWHFQVSHLGYEVTAFPAMLTIALWLLAKSNRRGNSFFLLVAAGFILGLTAYTYPVARFLVPVYFLIGPSLLIEKPLKRLLFATTLVLMVTPLIAAIIQNPAIFFSRFNEISIFLRPDPLLTLTKNYLSYFSPQFLFLKGSPDILFSTKQAGALLLSFTLPLATGLLITANLAIRKNYWAIFLVLGLLLSPIASALTFDNQPHLLRAAGSIPFIVVVTTFGVWYLLKKLPMAVSVALILVFLIEAGIYFYDFNFLYPQRVKMDQAAKQVEVTGFTKEDLKRFYRI
jgi:4-amino-4-deoxy-L-arabinose transferase-like glycosyltransferase